MDETQKLIEAPHRSKKTLYLFLILVFLVVLVSLMFFNTTKEKVKELSLEEQKILSDLRAESKFKLSKSEEQKISEDLKKDSSVDLSEEEQEPIIRSLQQ